jgi:hypothetical protein
VVCGAGEGGPIFSYGSAEVCAALRDFWLRLYAEMIEMPQKIQEAASVMLTAPLVLLLGT